MSTENKDRSYFSAGPKADWKTALGDPAYSMIPGQPDLDQILALFPRPSGKPAFDPQVIAENIKRLQTAPPVNTGHPFLDLSVKTGLAHIDATFRGDHPKYGVGTSTTTHGSSRGFGDGPICANVRRRRQQRRSLRSGRSPRHSRKTLSVQFARFGRPIPRTGGCLHRSSRYRDLPASRPPRSPPTPTIATGRNCSPAASCRQISRIGSSSHDFRREGSSAA
jgi:hypothetical protein